MQINKVAVKNFHLDDSKVPVDFFTVSGSSEIWFDVWQIDRALQYKQNGVINILSRAEKLSSLISHTLRVTGKSQPKGNLIPSQLVFEVCSRRQLPKKWVVNSFVSWLHGHILEIQKELHNHALKDQSEPAEDRISSIDDMVILATLHLGRATENIGKHFAKEHNLTLREVFGYIEKAAGVLKITA